MRGSTKLIVGLFVSSLLWHPAQTPAQGSETHCLISPSPISDVFAKAAIVLRSKTAVPLRLPACVWGLGSGDELYAVVKSVDESGYVVVLGATPDCEGQHVCSYGTMIGTSRPLNQIDQYDVTRRPRTLVKFGHGLTGYFYASVCGAYCRDSFITWTEGSYHYIIGLKAEKRSDMIESVNSAIEASGIH